MSTPLRPAARYASLEQQRYQLARMDIDFDESVRSQLSPALFGFELHWLTATERDGVSPAQAGSVALQLLGWARTTRELRPAHLLELHRLLATDKGGSYRTQSVPSLTPNHQVLAPERVARAMERFFEWVASPAFEEMHAIEQMSIVQVRLLEIQPFPAFTRLTVSFFAQSFLLRKAHPIALYPEGQQATFDDVLDQAFQFSTDPLVGWNLSACERAYASLIEAGPG